MTSANLTDLFAYLDDSPSPYHAVSAAVERLAAAGFTELVEGDIWSATTGRRYVRRGGTLVAWATPDSQSDTPCTFRIIGAHTDSPNLRIKPRPDTGSHGVRQLGVEVYGGALMNSWLDRDLGVSGRLTVRDGDETRDVLVRNDDIGLRIPQLAIHLDREVNAKGLLLNAQNHLTPIWGLGSPSDGDFLDLLTDRAGLGGIEVLGHDLMVHDLTPARFLGADNEFVASARLDNLLSCHAGLWALLAAVDTVPAGGATPVLCLFDHEEIGSTSASGAAGTVLSTVLGRIVHGLGGDADALAASLARSACVSADGAHATHPNYPDRHDPEHHVSLDGGPVVKFNANVRYATDGPSAAAFVLACEQASVPFQRFVMRSDLACGSTIGPLTAAQLGVSTVDVGVAQLSMHSSREMCGSVDPERFAVALAAFLALPTG